MTQRITIDSALLEAHSRAVEGVAADVRLGIQAAGQTMLSSGAFGLMCSWMVPPFLGVASLATATMTSAGGALETSAESLRAVAADFDRFEERAATQWRALARGIEG